MQLVFEHKKGVKMKRYKIRIEQVEYIEFELTKKNKKEVLKEIEYMEEKTELLKKPYVEERKEKRIIIKRKLWGKKNEKNS